MSVKSGILFIFCTFVAFCNRVVTFGVKIIFSIAYFFPAGYLYFYFFYLIFIMFTFFSSSSLP